MLLNLAGKHIVYLKGFEMNIFLVEWFEKDVFLINDNCAFTSNFQKQNLASV